MPKVSRMTNKKHMERILIVDDEAFNRKILADLFKGKYTVVQAKDGKQALARAMSDTPPNLILLDIMMPGMDGYEVMGQLKNEERTKDIPVIFVTAMDGESDEVAGLKLGAVDFIPKPFRTAVVELRVSNHLRLQRYHKMLETMSYHDGLTTIPNRRNFDSALYHEWNRAVRDQSNLAVLMMDVDHFKQYNDHYGHQEGDNCLQNIALTLSAACKRNIDLVARYGGEEFVALLPGTAEDGARSVAESFRLAIMELNIPHVDSSIAKVVTISIGGAVVSPTTAKEMETVIKIADDCLYQSKKNGRNQVTCITHNL